MNQVTRDLMEAPHNTESVPVGGEETFCIIVIRRSGVTGGSESTLLGSCHERLNKSPVGRLLQIY